MAIFNGYVNLPEGIIDPEKFNPWQGLCSQVTPEIRAVRAQATNFKCNPAAPKWGASDHKKWGKHG